LAWGGSKTRPFYHITVADSQRSRNGRFVERVGFFNPIAQGADEKMRLDLDRIEFWIRQGAQPSERVASLIKRYRKAASATTSEEAAA
jgi:small subunit ribosomal protein S16